MDSYKTDYYQATNTQTNEKSFTSLGENLRVDFIRKVFSIVAAQLLTTFAMSFYAITNESFYLFQMSNTGLFMFTAMLSICILIILSCFSSISRNYPMNFILLGLFTLCESYTVSAIVGSYHEKTVLMALFLTGSVVAALTIYSLKTKREIGYFSGLIVMGSCATLVGLFGSLIFGGGMLSGMISIVSAVMAGLYLIYDIKMLMGNDRRKIGLDDYVMGAMVIYLDVIRIFLEILKFLNSMENDKKEKRRR